MTEYNYMQECVEIQNANFIFLIYIHIKFYIGALELGAYTTFHYFIKKKWCKA